MRTPPPPPNLVLITLDTTRSDYLGYMGGGDHTPHIDALAAQSVRFVRATTVTNNTLPAHLSMLTGQHPATIGVPRNGHALAADVPVLAEQLSAAGYQTAAFVSASALSRDLGIDRGFETFDQTFPVQEMDQRQRRAEATTDAALAWIEGANEDKPFFLWVHYFDPHYPYTPPEEYLPKDGYRGPADGSLEYLLQVWGRAGRTQIETTVADQAHMIGRYSGELAYLDAQLGRLMAGVGAEPWVVLTADHGESLTEHNYLFDHGEYLYQPSLAVPLLLRAPGVEPSDNTGQAQVIDVAPTFIAAAGLPLTQGIAGQDLNAAQYDVDTIRAVAFAESCRPWTAEQPGQYANRLKAQSATAWPWKLIVTPFKQHVELYNLQQDPQELNNVVDENPDVVAELAAALEVWRSGSLRTGTPHFENMEVLKALGYVE